MVSDSQFSTTYKNDEERRKELGDFLRTRRARVKPPQLKDFPLPRRRTPGLRREEVAEMSGVSTSWYTWLEQGRDIHPSVELLVRLGKALDLNVFELNHLFDLAGKNAPEILQTHQNKVPSPLQHLVLSVIQIPAFVINERCDFLLWNQSFTKQVYDLNEFPQEHRNWLEVMFIENSIRRKVPDWKKHASRVVAEFRWSVGKQIGSPWVKELVDRLRHESPEFSELWKLHEVQTLKGSQVLEIFHEEFGNRSFVRSILIPFEAENLRLVTLTPVTDD